MPNQQASRSSRRPSFFKPMIGDFKNTIRIPVAFTRRLSPAIYTISDPTGSSRWDVTVNKVEQVLCFTTGWPSFVQQNSLDFGDLAVFTYLVGTFNFEVKVFGLNGCEKPLFQPHAKNATDQEVVPTKTNKRSRRLMDQQVSVKRKKSCWENGSRVEEQTCETHLKSLSSIPGQISLRKSKRLEGKTIKICRRKKSNQDDVISAEAEGLSILSNSERSDDQGETEVIPVHSSDSESEDTEVHRNSREHVNSTEEVEVHQDGLDSPIQNESSSFTSMCQWENPFCKIVLTRSYLSRGFMHCPRKLVRCLAKKPTGRFNLRLHVANRKIWDVVLTCTERKDYLCSGWAKFVEKNNLREGDVCLMEVIKRGKLDLKVSIHRKASATPAKCNA